MSQIGVWFPAVRAYTGADVFTERLCAGLSARGLRCEITWLPHRAEYMPWGARPPRPPAWATMVHINSWLPPRFVPKHLPLLVTVHHGVHDAMARAAAGVLRRVYRRRWILPIEAQNVARAAAVVAVSGYVAKQVTALFGDIAVHVVPNGIDTETLFVEAPTRSLHRPFRILYVGNWKPLKGVDLLAPIMTRLGPDFELFYTADSAGRHHAYTLPRNTRCIGRLDAPSLVNAYHEADALLFPSRSEGLGLTVIEAMACGLPVVASDIEPLVGLIDHGSNGILCRVGDVEAFSMGMRVLAHDANVRVTMGRNARKTAERDFAESRQIDSYSALYARVAESEAKLNRRR